MIKQKEKKATLQFQKQVSNVQRRSTFTCENRRRIPMQTNTEQEKQGTKEIKKKNKRNTGREKGRLMLREQKRRIRSCHYCIIHKRVLHNYTRKLFQPHTPSSDPTLHYVHISATCLYCLKNNRLSLEIGTTLF